MADQIRVVVAGAAGRMGSTTCGAVEGADDMALVARVDPALDGPSLAEAMGEADVLVDFSIPDAAAGNAQLAIESGVHAVVGTTGFDLDALRTSIGGDGGEANCLIVPNFAIGAVLMMELSRRAAEHMPEAEIIELHHDQKKDSPSGTAKRTAELIREAGGNVHEPIHSVRLQGYIAHQEVIFGALGQTLTIRHDTTSRESFMPGVLLAVREVGGMSERFVVGLENVL